MKNTPENRTAVNAIIARHCPEAAAPGTPDDPDSAPLGEDTLSGAHFSFADFGTLVHARLEAAARGLPPEAFTPQERLFKDLTAAERHILLAACEQMAAGFAESELGAQLSAARDAHRLVKAEWAFRTVRDGLLVTGSIDLLFENEDSGTYTIVDYKSDRELRPAMYYAQQACYRLAASRLLGVSPGNIRCVLYYLRYGKTVDITGAMG